MKKIFPAWLVLTVICIVAAGLLAATNLATKDVIAANAQKEAMETLGKLLPQASAFETLESGISVGKDTEGNVIGYALAATTQGFGGEVETTVAALPDGTINGISVGGSNFAETAGLGARAKEPEFQEQFAGKKAPVALTKDGGEIEALSGATITSRAVIKGVNEAMDGIAGEAGFTVESTSTAEHLGDGQYAATAPGFGGPVKVFLTLDENRTITDITIGDEQFAETAGLGARAKEEDFRNQFVGKTLPVVMGDIDALAGATITTNAVIEAIGFVSDGLDNGLAEAPITETAAIPSDEEEKTEETSEEPAAETAEATAETAETKDTNGNEYSASAQGFGGPVMVYVTLDENRTITGLTIGDDQFAETEGLGARAKEEDFRNQFIGKTVPVSLEDIDSLAGATVTTTAVVNAINQAADAQTTEETSEEPAAETAEATVETAETKDTNGNEYSASAQGFGGPVTVYVTLDENRTITGLTIGDDQFAETEGLGARAKEEDFRNQFIGKTVPVSLEDIDSLAGATVTTTAVVNAINQAADAQTTEETSEEPAAETAEETAETAEGDDNGSAETKTDHTDKGDGRYFAASATVQGFGGPVKVVVTVDENRVIKRIIIGDDQFAETEGLGARAKEENFRNQFIGKTVPVSLEDIDGLTGATITTTAVVNAINQAADAQTTEETSEEPAAETAEETAETAEGDDNGSAEAKTDHTDKGDDRYFAASATVQGFGGPVKVVLTLDGNRVIKRIIIGDDQFAETEGLGARAKEEDFRNQFIGKTVPVSLEDIDGLTGATITTKAVVNAINQTADLLP